VAATGRRQAGPTGDHSDAAVQCCLTLKVLFGLPLRQTQGFVQSVLALSGLGGAGLQHGHLTRAAPAGGFHRDQDARRRRMEDPQARGGVPAVVAQGPRGH
jgi:hypothetical protein